MSIKISAFTQFRTLLFSTNRQMEFLDNYLSLKGDEDSPLSDKDVFLGVKEVYSEIFNESRFEVLICDFVIDSLARGESVHEALAPFLDRDIVLAFKATAEVGQTDYGLKQVIKNITAQNEMQKSFLKSIKRGLVFLVIGILFVLGVSTFALPAMMEMLDKSDLDPMALYFLDLNIFLEANGARVTLVVILLVSIYLYSLKNWHGKSRDLVDNFFLYKPYKGFAANRFFNMLTLLKSSKLSLRQSLEVIDGETSPFMQHHLEQMLDMTREGGYNLEQLDTGLLTPRLKVRLKAAGMSGNDNMDEVFGRIASSASEDFEKGLLFIGGQISFWLIISGLCLCLMSVFVMLGILMSMAFSM